MTFKFSGMVVLAKRNQLNLVVFFFFLVVFYKTIIPLALVGYDMIIANEVAPLWLSVILYPTRAGRIIVNYMQSYLVKNCHGHTFISLTSPCFYIIQNHKTW